MSCGSNMALQSHPPPSSVALAVNNGAALTELRKRPREDSSTSTSGLHQNVASDFDALISHQCEETVCRLEEARKRHRAALISEVNRQVSRGLQQKEAELEKARRRAAELEVKLRKAGAEGRMWFMAAKNSEAAAFALRASLEQVLLQNAVAAAAAAAAATNPPAEEGSGDTDDDDAQSFYLGGKEAAAPEVRRRCRACGEREAVVVMFPCRHLCLCRACQSNVDSCPACGSPHRTCFEVFLA